MVSQGMQGSTTRRDVLKGVLKTGAYAAPVIVASAITTGVAAVTGVGGVTLFINGGNTASLTRSSTISLTGSGYQPGSTVYFIYRANTPTSTRPSDAYQIGTYVVPAGGTLSISEAVLMVAPVRINGPGSFSVFISTGYNSLPDTSVQITGVLVSLNFTVTS